MKTNEIDFVFLLSHCTYSRKLCFCMPRIFFLLRTCSVFIRRDMQCTFAQRKACS